MTCEDNQSMEYFKMIPYWAMGRLRRLYFMALPEDSKDMEKSRKLYTMADSANQTIIQLSGGTFLVALMSAIGISDGTMGIILSMCTLASVFQLPVMNYVQKMKKRKLFICIATFQKIWLFFIFFIPLFPWPKAGKIAGFLIAFTFAQICTQMSTPAITDWIASLVPMRLRGRYFSVKDTFAVLSTVTGMLIAGIAFDYISKRNEMNAFIMMGVTLLVLALINAISLSLMKEPRITRMDMEGHELHGHLLQKEMRIHPMEERMDGVWKEIRDSFAYAPFRVSLTLNCLWMLCFYFAAPFNSSYLVKDMGYSYTFIMIVNFAVNLVRVMITPKVGKKADSIGMAKMLKYVLCVYFFGYLLMSLLVPGGSVVIYIISSLCFALAWSFISIGLLGVHLEFLQEEQRTVQYTILSVISGVFGFVISIIAGCLIDFLRNHILFLAGKQIFSQQITNAIAALFAFLTVLYLHFVVQRTIVKNQEKKDTKP